LGSAWERAAVVEPADSSVESEGIGGKVQERLACRYLGRNCNREVSFDRKYRLGYPVKHHSIGT